MSDEMHQLQESLKLVLDLTARIDERLRHLVESNQRDFARIDRNLTEHHQRISNVETKTIALEIRTDGSESKWKLIVDSLFKLAVTVAAGAILWKMGMRE